MDSNTMRKTALILMVLVSSALLIPMTSQETDSLDDLVITGAEQRLNEDTGNYYLFIYFDRELLGKGVISIPEISFTSTFNVDDQINKSRLVMIIGETAMEPGTYTLGLGGDVVFQGKFTIDEQKDGDGNTTYLIIGIIAVIAIVCIALIAIKRR